MEASRDSFRARWTSIGTGISPLANTNSCERPESGYGSVAIPTVRRPVLSSLPGVRLCSAKVRISKRQRTRSSMTTSATSMERYGTSLDSTFAREAM